MRTARERRCGELTKKRDRLPSKLIAQLNQLAQREQTDTRAAIGSVKTRSSGTAGECLQTLYLTLGNLWS